MNSYTIDEWHGCYKRGWGRELVPEAFAHPAKVSFSLAERIYAHMAAEGWIEPGMTVVDPFGGIGKPEPLRYEWSGYWSRRITKEHRLIYRVEPGILFIAQCRFHYDS